MASAPSIADRTTEIPRQCLPGDLKSAGEPIEILLICRRGKNAARAFRATPSRASALDPGFQFAFEKRQESGQIRGDDLGWDRS